MGTNFDAIVIGGGVIGCSIARELSGRGLQVALLERSQPGAETSRVSVGCTVGGSAEEPHGQIEFLQASKNMYPSLEQELMDETGINIESICRGTIVMAFDEIDEQGQTETYNEQRGFGLDVERLSKSEILDLEPAISPNVRNGLFYKDDGQVNNNKLVKALLRSALLRGTELFHATAQSLIFDDNRVIGVEILSGEKLRSKYVINAAGTWADQIEGMPKTGIVPAKGQTVIMYSFDRHTSFRHVVMTPSTYIVPRPDGELRLGSTVEFVGFDSRGTVGAVQELLKGAIEMAPNISYCTFGEVLVGFRPCPPDFLPIIGSSTVYNGLIFATGHHRYGITLAPLTASIVAAEIFSAPPPFNYDRYKPDRFNI